MFLGSLNHTEHGSSCNTSGFYFIFFLFYWDHIRVIKGSDKTTNLTCNFMQGIKKHSAAMPCSDG